MTTIATLAPQALENRPEGGLARDPENTLAWRRARGSNPDEKGNDSRVSAIRTFLKPDAPAEEPGPERNVVDHQSLPLEERVEYYRSEIEKLAARESFREEVLFEVYSYLLTQSLQQQESG